MKKMIVAVIVVLSYATMAFAGTAKWTGKQLPVPEGTGFTAKCEYSEGLVKFWRLTNGPCEPIVKSNTGFVPKSTKNKKEQRNQLLNFP